MNLLQRSLAAFTLLICALPAFAQSSPERRTAIGAPDLPRQLAAVAARRTAWQTAAAQLQARPDVQALRLTPAQVEAFTAALVDPEKPVDPDSVARGMARLRNDQGAAPALVAAWAEMQQLYQRLAAARSADEQERILLALRVRHLTARATAALARTEPATVGGRVPTASGREQARRLAAEAAALAPDAPAVHSLHGDVLLDAEQPEAAEAEYRKALVGNETSSAARINLAEVLRLQGKFDEAIAQLRDALRLDPKSAAAHTDIGLILRAQGKVDEAVAEYRAAISLDPDWTDAHNGLAVTLAGQGKMDQAADAFREIIRVDPDSTIGHYNLATALANLDRDVEAAAELREVIRIYPNHYNARFNLGELFRLEAKYDEAAKQFREYIRLAPDTPQNQRNLRRARQHVEEFTD